MVGYWKESAFIEELLREAHAVAKLSTEDVKRIPELSEASHKAIYGAAYRFYRDGKYDSAEDFFRLLTLLDGGDGRYWLGLGATRQMRQSYDSALEAYAVAAMMDPASAQPHVYAAECYFQQQNREEGVAALKMAEELASTEEAAPHVKKQLEVLRAAWNLGARPEKWST